MQITLSCKMNSWNPLDVLANTISEKLGSDLPSIRFLMTIFLGYPIAFVYLLCIRQCPVRIVHLYFLLTGFLLSYWNYGFGTAHLFIGMGVTLATLHMFGPTDLSVGLSFIFNMTYLLTGYYFMNYGTYDINWTMSYCVLCLRLMGLAWDYRDGSLPQDKLSEYQKGSAFKRLPDPLETASFCIFPTASFAGPLFTWRHYKAFIEQSLRPEIVLKNRTSIQKYFLNPKLHRTLSRFVMGLVCIGIYVFSLTYVPMEYLLTDEFLQKRWFPYRLGYLCLFSKFLIMRYLAIWLIGEGSCVLLGLGCTGRIHVHFKDATNGVVKKDEKTMDLEETRFRRVAVLSNASVAGALASDFDFKELSAAVSEGRASVVEAEHTQCANISVIRFESATNTDLLVSSFNINTNKFMLEYTYKRLKFLGNKNLSQLITLTFLAVWHGFYSGYFVNFFLEFIIIFVEKQLLFIVHKSVYADFLHKSFPGRLLSSIIGKLHVFFLLAFPMTAFSLLRVSQWLPVFNSVYWVGFIYLLWPLMKPLFTKLFPPKQTPVCMAKESNAKMQPENISS